MAASVRGFIQARMSSQRYPGKVLAPFRGEPLIRHVLRAAETVMSQSNTIVVTSTHRTDDPLAAYLHSIGAQVFRGPLDNVVQRFLLCLQDHPCDWVLRINGDSPLMWPELIRLFVGRSMSFTGDLLTTIAPRTFPRGQNLELIGSAALRSLVDATLTVEDQGHVTPYFYRHPDRYRIENVESGDARLGETSLAVDTLEDLKRLECLDARDLLRFSPPVLAFGVTS